VGDQQKHVLVKQFLFSAVQLMALGTAGFAASIGVAGVYLGRRAVAAGVRITPGKPWWCRPRCAHCVFDKALRHCRQPLEAASHGSGRVNEALCLAWEGPGIPGGATAGAGAWEVVDANAPIGNPVPSSGLRLWSRSSVMRALTRPWPSHGNGWAPPREPPPTAKRFADSAASLGNQCALPGAERLLRLLP